jgi:dolichyl-phosphate beta-glucosyltransferase
VQHRSLSLILPVHEAAGLLPGLLEETRVWLGSLERETELVVVDDGSRDATPRLVAACAAAHADAGVPVRPLLLGQNRGKGHAVARGLLLARGDLRVFVDGDPSYPLENVARVVEALEGGADLAVGDRTLPGSRLEGRGGGRGTELLRHALSRLWNVVLRAGLRLPFPDTQAGVKGVRGDVAPALFGDLLVEGFAFDVEVLLRARRLGLSVRRVPVRRLRHGHASSLRLLRDGLRMLRDVARLRRRYGAPAARGRSASRTSA